jgi:hypothetical protein|uniref:Phytanoyl-CoA dioxygenase n=1 Tax=viral metagenome TaxID=1070528 RepID=A0A6C0H1Q4_9ZZZZ
MNYIKKYWRETTFISIVIQLIVILFVIMLFSILYRWVTVQSTYTSSLPYKTQLEKHGVVLIHNVLSKQDIENLKKYASNDNIIDAKKYIVNSYPIKSIINNLLGKDYIFQDYIFLIKRSQFHTCHRDYNGDLYNETQKHPSYTILFYLDEMEKCLDVLPQSHLTREHDYNLTDYTQTVYCRAGDAILFNANLVHNGSLNEDDKHMRIQMKVSHRSDLKTLGFYNKYNKILNVDSNDTMIFKRLQKHVTCQFPILSNYIKQYDKNNADNNTQNESTSSFFSSLFPKLKTVVE